MARTQQAINDALFFETVEQMIGRATGWPTEAEVTDACHAIACFCGDTFGSKDWPDDFDEHAQLQCRMAAIFALWSRGKGLASSDAVLDAMLDEAETYLRSAA